MNPGSPTPSENPSLKYLLGGGGLLQVVLTTVGVSNGGVSALVINHLTFVIIGFSAVFLAIAAGGFVVLTGSSDKALGKVVTAVGSLLLFVGIAIAGYAALVAPAVAKAPDIDATLSDTSGQLLLTAHVKASGIAESDLYWIEVDAREYLPNSTGGGKYVPLGTPLYQNQLGADSLGNIDTTLTIPLPPGKFNVVSIEGWNGAHAGPCGSLATESGADLTHAPKIGARAAATNVKTSVATHGRAGCLVVRLPR